MLPKRWRPAAGLGLLLALSCAVAAAPPVAEVPHPLGELRLDQAATLALRAHPDLARYAYDRAAADGRRVQAGLSPRTEVGVDLENFAGSGPYRNADSIEATLRLAKVWQSARKREARIGVASAQIEQVDADTELARLDVLAETTRRFIDVVESQEQLDLAQRGVDNAKLTLSAAERRVRAGAASSLEVNRARIALERAQLDYEHYEHLLSTQRRMLGAQWGESEPQFDHARAELRTLPETDEYSVLVERLRRSPDFARYDVEQRLRNAELSYAQSQVNGDPLFSAGVRRLQSTGDYALIASMLLPLPIGNRNQGAIAEAAALRDRVGVERRAAAVRSETTLYDFVQELRHARTMVESLRDVLVPQAEEALTLTRRGYANGRYSQIDLLDAQKTRLDLERELLTNAADYHRMLAAVERMTALAAAPNGTPSP
ncbi:TolC family protein [Solimonas variicoloris]|uniref:TolC family protein n=1 Tax=Solimonas variicoloris TaxID=254408 RepID=UPI0003718236|nr:TolC family protein [Solimonas variicoloris]